MSGVGWFEYHIICFPLTYNIVETKKNYLSGLHLLTKYQTRRSFPSSRILVWVVVLAVVLLVVTEEKESTPTPPT